jgi:ribose transport system ATP-binding protein
VTTAPAHSALDALQVRGVSKHFGATRALHDVDLDLRRGEVHALVGGNGSGKSTLIKVLAGVHHADSGTLRVRGEEHSLVGHGPEQAKALGLRFVHQDLGIFPTLSVAENLFIGNGFEQARGGRICWARSRDRAKEVLSRFELDLDPARLVSSLSVPQHAMIAIARALQDAEDDNVLVLDEPTASLPPSEVRVLSAAIRRLADSGRAVLLVTHRLDEVRRLADRVTAIRDGQRIDTVAARALTERDLVALIMGRDLVTASAPRAVVRDADPVLSLVGVSAGPLRDIDLVVRPGEVVGVAGLLGSGRTELLETVFGVLPLHAGTVLLAGQRVTPTPGSMRALGVAFVPEDRKEQGIFPGRSVRENMTEGRLTRYFRRMWLRDGRIRADVEGDITRFAVKTASSLTPIDDLSGGNQQKVVLARCLREGPVLLLLDEPTQGIDVGAREEIFELVNAAATAGCAVLLVSSEFEELVRLSHRVLVLSQGRITQEHRTPVDARTLLESTLTAGAGAP